MGRQDLVPGRTLNKTQLIYAPFIFFQLNLLILMESDSWKRLRWVSFINNDSYRSNFFQSDPQVNGRWFEPSAQAQAVT